MSVVTDVVLVTGVSGGFERGVENLNRWLETSRPGFEGGWGNLARVDESAGGTKAMQGNVYLGAFNHFDTDGFVAAIRVEKWPYRGVRLLVQEEFADDWAFIDPWRENLDHYRIEKLRLEVASELRDSTWMVDGSRIEAADQDYWLDMQFLLDQI